MMNTTLFHSLNINELEAVLKAAQFDVIKKCISIGWLTKDDILERAPFYKWLIQVIETQTSRLTPIRQLPLELEEYSDLFPVSESELIQWISIEVEQSIRAASHNLFGIGENISILKENGMQMTNSFADKLNNNISIKIDYVRRGVMEICIKAQLITHRDINARTRRYLWLEDIIERHLLTLGILNQLMLKQAEVSKGDVIDGDEWIAEVVKNVSRRVLEERLP